MKKYWILDEPNSVESDDSFAKFYYHNGCSHVSYRIPGVICPICDNWHEIGTYPFKCPKQLLNIPEIQSDSPLPLREFKRLMEIVELAFEEEGLKFSPELMDERFWMNPGLDFLDRTFEICCHPPYSFLWSRIKDSPIVKQEIKDTFEINQVSGISFHSVTMKYVGKAIADTPPADMYSKIYVPGWWTAPNYFDPAPIYIEPEENPESFGPLYYMYVHHCGADWRDWKNISRCPSCRQYKKIKRPQHLKFNETFVTNYDVFRTDAVAYNRIVVSEKVYEILKQYEFTNYSLKDFYSSVR